MADDLEADQTALEITKRMQKFAEDFFGNLSNQYILIDSEFYSQNPIVGFDLLLNTIRPIPKREQFELKAIQVLIRKLVQCKFPENYRQNRWLADGLSHYIFMRYVETYFPELRLTGNLAELPSVIILSICTRSLYRKNKFTSCFCVSEKPCTTLLTPKSGLDKIQSKNRFAIPFSYGNQNLRRDRK